MDTEKPYSLRVQMFIINRPNAWYAHQMLSEFPDSALINCDLVLNLKVPVADNAALKAHFYFSGHQPVWGFFFGGAK